MTSGPSAPDGAHSVYSDASTWTLDDADSMSLDHYLWMDLSLVDKYNGAYEEVWLIASLGCSGSHNRGNVTWQAEAYGNCSEDTPDYGSWSATEEAEVKWDKGTIVCSVEEPSTLEASLQAKWESWYRDIAVGCRASGLNVYRFDALMGHNGFAAELSSEEARALAHAFHRHYMLEIGDHYPLVAVAPNGHQALIYVLDKDFKASCAHLTRDGLGWLPAGSNWR